MPRPTPFRRVAHHIPCGSPCSFFQQLQSLSERTMACEPCIGCCGQNIQPCIVARRRRCQPPVPPPCLPRHNIGFSCKPMETNTIYQMSYKKVCDTCCDPCKPKCGRPSRCIYRRHPPRTDTYPCCYCDLSCDPCGPCYDPCAPPCCDPPGYCGDPCGPPCCDPPPRCCPRPRSCPRAYCGKRDPILPRNHLGLSREQFATKDQTTHNMSYQPFMCEDLYYCY